MYFCEVITIFEKSYAKVVRVSAPLRTGNFTHSIRFQATRTNYPFQHSSLWCRRSFCSKITFRYCHQFFE